MSDAVRVFVGRCRCGRIISQSLPATPQDIRGKSRDRWVRCAAEDCRSITRVFPRATDQYAEQLDREARRVGDSL